MSKIKRDYIDAIGYLKESKCEQTKGEIYKVNHNIVLDLAIETLEKQIPKIAMETQELIQIDYICPECEHINHSEFNYCWNCGQAITH